MEDISQENKLQKTIQDVNQIENHQENQIEQKSWNSCDENEQNFLKSLDDVGFFESAIKKDMKPNQKEMFDFNNLIKYQQNKNLKNQFRLQVKRFSIKSNDVSESESQRLNNEDIYKTFLEESFEIEKPRDLLDERRKTFQSYMNEKMMRFSEKSKATGSQKDENLLESLSNEYFKDIIQEEYSFDDDENIGRQKEKVESFVDLMNIQKDHSNFRDLMYNLKQNFKERINNEQNFQCEDQNDDMNSLREENFEDEEDENMEIDIDDKKHAYKLQYQNLIDKISEVDEEYYEDESISKRKSSVKKMMRKYQTQNCESIEQENFFEKNQFLSSIKFLRNQTKDKKEFVSEFKKSDEEEQMDINNDIFQSSENFERDSQNQIDLNFPNNNYYSNQQESHKLSILQKNITKVKIEKKINLNTISPHVKFELESKQQELEFSEMKQDSEQSVHTLGEQSEDSIDRQWQAALKYCENAHKDELESSYGIDQEKSIYDNNLKIQQLEQMKYETAKTHRKQMKNLISFDFLTSSKKNFQNVCLSNYQLYFENQMHLAPSTDANSAIYISQIESTLENSLNKSVNIVEFQELGFIDFYGVPNTPDVIISMLLLTNSVDIMDQSASNLRICYQKNQYPIRLFNNPQQYFIPHKQFNHLQTVIFNIKEKLKVQLFDPEDIQQLKKHVIQEQILNYLDIGILLLMGKMHFHLCEFERAAQCLQICIQKCKSQNNQQLFEALLWIIIVQKVSLLNQLRIFKKQIALQSYKASLKGLNDKQIENIEIPKNLLKDIEAIVQVGQTLSEYIKDFKEYYTSDQNLIFQEKQPENDQKMVIVLYIQLKLEILKLSELFQYFMKIVKYKFNLEYQEKRELQIQTKYLEFQNKINLTRANSPRSSIQNSVQKIQRSRQNSLITYQIQSDELNIENQHLIDQPKVSSFIQFSKNIFSNIFNIQQESENLNCIHQDEMEFDDQLNSKKNLSDIPEEENEMIKTIVIHRDFTIKTLQNTDQIKNLQKIIETIEQYDYYTGQIAFTELLIFQSSYKQSDYFDLQFDETQFFNNIQEIFKIIEQQSVYDFQNSNFELLEIKQINQSIQILNDQIRNNENKILAGIKLWQIYVFLQQISLRRQLKGIKAQQNFDDLLLITSQTIHQHFTSSRYVGCDLFSKEILITLINVKSQYFCNFHKDCYENLQCEILRMSKHSSFLYIYGKYIVKQIKSFYDKESKLSESLEYIGSGIGALEECLQQCIPQFYSRVYFYIGLAYISQNQNHNMPIKTIAFWNKAINYNSQFNKKKKYESCVQGKQKLQQMRKYLDEFSFIQIIIDMINKCIKKNKNIKELEIDDETQQTAIQYLEILNTFQKKVDGPSCLILKANIYAHALNNHNQAIQCFEELISCHSEIILGHIEYWNFLSHQYKLISKLHQEQIQENKIQKLQKNGEQQSILKKIKQITRNMIHLSNICHHISTSEWVKVRIIAAKSYLFEHKFNKAIHILTELCYIIPPEMFKIGQDSQKIIQFFSKEIQQDFEQYKFGGIKFCNQVLADDEDCQTFFEEQNPFAETLDIKMSNLISEDIEKKQNYDNKFKNKIFKDRIQQDELINDFYDTESFKVVNQDLNNMKIVCEKEKEKYQRSVTFKKSFTLKKQKNILTSQEPQTGNFTSRQNTKKEELNFDQYLNEQNDLRNKQADKDQSMISFQRDNSNILYFPQNFQSIQRENENFSSAKLILSKESSKNTPEYQQSFDTNIRKSYQTNVEKSNFFHLKQKIKDQLLNFNSATPLNSLNNTAEQYQNKDELQIRIFQDILEQRNNDRSSIKSGSQKFDISKFKEIKRLSIKKDMSNTFKINSIQDIKKDIKIPKIVFSIQSIKEDIQYFQKQNQKFRNSDQFLEDQSQNNQSLNQTQRMPRLSHISDRKTVESRNFNTKRDSNLDSIKLNSEHFQPQNGFIFAVNSDVHFLYMIGKICCRYNENLFQGLLALNDYYLFNWHYGKNEISSLKNMKALPFQEQLDIKIQGSKVKECVKTLLLIGKIYEQLSQPKLSLKMYFKILEDKESLISSFECGKYIKETELGVTRCWKLIVQSSYSKNGFDAFQEEDRKIFKDFDIVKIQKDHFI